MDLDKDVKYDADNMTIRGKYDNVFEDDEEAVEYSITLYYEGEN